MSCPLIDRCPLSVDLCNTGVYEINLSAVPDFVRCSVRCSLSMFHLGNRSMLSELLLSMVVVV